ncbi:MAG: glycosyltransferase family 39 protein [Phycisphaeraceae bacterium]|nr:glycosyltransferase family 39 protein [Phycisphaeraceae bacterium]
MSTPPTPPHIPPTSPAHAPGHLPPTSPTIATPPGRNWIAILAGPVILAIIFLAMLAWTWRTWPDPLVDFGRELYVAWQISAGRTLYTDIAYFNGPLSAYFNGLLFRLLGPGLIVLALANAVILAAFVALLYRIFLRLAPAWVATAAGLAFLLLFAFGQFVTTSNYNFITPYSHELTHGLMLALASVYLLWRSLETRKTPLIFAAGLALGLTFLTKPEPFLAGLAGAAAVAVAHRLAAPPPRQAALALILVPLVGFLLPILIGLLLLSMAMTPAQAWTGLLGGWNWVFSAELQALPFYRAGMGLLPLAENLRSLGLATAAWAGMLLPLYLLALVLPCGKRVNLLLGLLAFWYMLIPLASIWANIAWFDALRPLPVFLVLACVVNFASILRARREGHQATGPLALTMGLLVFSLVFLLKMLLNARIYNYGFALAAPATWMLVLTWLAWIPRHLTRRGRAGGIFAGATLAILVVATGVYLAQMNLLMTRKTLALGQGRDMFYADERAAVLDPLLKQVHERVGPGQAVLVVPEGVMLNYLARRVSPTPYLNFMPPELIIFGEDDIIMALHRSQPDFVLVTHKTTEEYGLPYFGHDYAQKLWLWIEENYQRLALYGDPPLVPQSKFGVGVMGRRAAAAVIPPLK